MKNKMKKMSKKAFTIVELLTVISIIVLLIGITLPAINYVRKYAKEVKQRTQFHAIKQALELFYNQQGYYPDSQDLAAIGQGTDHYFGAGKLGEAMVGWDFLGFNPRSKFDVFANQQKTVTPTNPMPLYPDNTTTVPSDSRKGPYLTLEQSGAHRLGELFGGMQPGPGTPPTYTYSPINIGGQSVASDIVVICDEYKAITNRHPNPSVKGKLGMPVLYYKANIGNTRHIYSSSNVSDPCQSANIYDTRDNDILLQKENPVNGRPHPMRSAPPVQNQPPPNPQIFYDATQDTQYPTLRPYMADTYILLSAGLDGLYGTSDDIYNFGD